MTSKFKRILIRPLIWLAAMLFLIEEFIWDSTARLMARLGAIRCIHAIELHIASLSPRWAAVAFMLPITTLIPAKLIGLRAISHGHWILGSLIFLIAKLLGMAMFSRIFNLTRPALLQILWFAKLYQKIMYYRNRIHGYLDQWAAYQRAKQHIRSLLAKLTANRRLKKNISD